MPGPDFHNAALWVIPVILSAAILSIVGLMIRRKKVIPKKSPGKRRNPSPTPEEEKKPKPTLTGPFVLPLPPNPKPLKIEIHTLRYGDADWLHDCVPTFDAWCARHSLPLYLRSEWDPSYPNSKFCAVDMLRDFLSRDSDWMMYVDADIVVHPQAPAPYFDEPGFHCRPDAFNLNPKQIERWREWCFEKFGARPDEAWIYRNCGVWACDRATAAALLSVIREPYHDGVMEQHQWNWWMQQAAKAGMKAPLLPTEWNRFPIEMEPAWMFHIYGVRKPEHLRNFRRAGLLPGAIQLPKFPLTDPRDLGKGAVVWPWMSSGAEEDALWYSSRSVIRHWSERDWPLVLVGDRRPGWWDGEFIHATTPAQALWLGAQSSDEVLWMGDPVILLADQSPDDFATTRHWGEKTDADIGKLLAAKDPARKQLGQTLLRLRHEGLPTRNHSTGDPQLYQRNKVRQVFDRFGITNHLPFETAYHDFHRSLSAASDGKDDRPDALAENRWILPRSKQMASEFRDELAVRFGAPK